MFYSGVEDGAQQRHQIITGCTKISFFFFNQSLNCNNFHREPPSIRGIFIDFYSESGRLQTLYPGIRGRKDRCESLTQRFEDQRGFLVGNPLEGS